MRTLNLVQGTDEWHEARANAFTASEAPMMMGASPFKKREQYLKEKALGIKEEVSPFLQKKFDEGHAAEEKARVLLEESLGEDFYPVVGEIELEGMRFLASFDGITLDECCTWEHKLWNEKKAEQMRNSDELLPEYYWQVEHGLIVSGANECIFEMSDGSGDPEKRIEITYSSIPERRKQLIEGWKQFAKDLAEFKEKAVEAPVEKQSAIELPEISIQVVGQVTASNLPVVQSRIAAMIERINEDLVTDDDFAEAEASVKQLAKAEKQLESAKIAMLEGTADINEVLKAIDELKDASRVKRLSLDKLVKARKVQMKQEIVKEASDELVSHVEELNRQIKIVSMPICYYSFQQGFLEAVKGKKLFSSMRDSVADALSQAKVAATIQAQELQEKIELFNSLSEGYGSLFSDKGFILTDNEEQLEIRVTSTIAQFQAEQEHQAQLQAAAEIEAAAEQSQPIEQPQPEAPETQERMSETRYALIGLGCSPAQSLRIENAIKAGQIPNVEYRQAKAA